MPDPYWQKVAVDAERERLLYIRKMASLVSNRRTKPIRRRRPQRRYKP